jgi:hypothetical protein
VIQYGRQDLGCAPARVTCTHYLYSNCAPSRQPVELLELVVNHIKEPARRTWDSYMYSPNSSPIRTPPHRAPTQQSEVTRWAAIGLQQLPRRLSNVSHSLGKRTPRAGKALFEPGRPMSIECANAGLPVPNSEADGTRWERIECWRTAHICAGRRWDMTDRVC